MQAAYDVGRRDHQRGARELVKSARKNKGWPDEIDQKAEGKRRRGKIRDCFEDPMRGNSKEQPLALAGERGEEKSVEGTSIPSCRAEESYGWSHQPGRENA